mmetsp:Transcript_33576/g.68684  ORF Transcript_33576/g.68684 Transcript_33576/m.68684 type:complete len:259 (-) Transcript_33576:179-955(-)
MLHHDTFHFQRGDVLTTRNDDVLGPVFQLDVAVWIPHSQVASVEDTAFELLCGRFRILEISFHDGIATHHNLTNGLSIARHWLASLWVYHFQILQLQTANTLPRQQRRFLFQGLAVPFIFPFAHHTCSVRLCQAVDMADFDAIVRHSGQHRRGGSSRRGHELQVLVPGLWTRVLKHGAHHNGSPRDVGHSVLLHRREDVIGHHLAQADVDPGHSCHGVGEEPAVQVENRHRPKVDAMPVQRPFHNEVHALQVGTPMVQ